MASDDKTSRTGVSAAREKVNAELRTARGKVFDHSPEVRRYMGIEQYKAPGVIIFDGVCAARGPRFALWWPDSCLRENEGEYFSAK